MTKNIFGIDTDETEIMKHYTMYKIPKQKGGFRTIHAPDQELSAVQEKIMNMLYTKYKASEYATAYKKSIGILFNGLPHRNHEILIKTDIKDFFHNITADMIIEALGEKIYPDMAEQIAMTCTIVMPDGKGGTKRVMPQGACTSPAISNIVMYKIDYIIASQLTSIDPKITYTRYADDMAISTDDKTITKDIIKTIYAILYSYRFEPNRKKTQVLGQHRRQIITGVVVNKVCNIPKSMERLFRARLHNLYCTVVKDKKQPAPHMQEYRWIRGYYSFMISINGRYNKKYGKKLSELTTAMGM